MDVQAIANLFATSLSVDPNVRKAGEIEIRRVSKRVDYFMQRQSLTTTASTLQIGNHEGVLTSLMQIIGNEGVDP